MHVIFWISSLHGDCVIMIYIFYAGKVSGDKRFCFFLGNLERAFAVVHMVWGEKCKTAYSVLAVSDL